MRSMGQFCTWNALLSSQKHCDIDFDCFHIHAASIRIYFGTNPRHTKNCHLYAPISQKLFSKLKSHSLNGAHEQKFSLTQKELVHTVILLTFTIRLKRRLNKKYFWLKKRKKTNTHLGVVKTAPQYNSNSLNCKNTTMSPKIAAIASRLLTNL